MSRALLILLATAAIAGIGWPALSLGRREAARSSAETVVARARVDVPERAGALDAAPTRTAPRVEEAPDAAPIEESRAVDLGVQAPREPVETSPLARRLQDPSAEVRREAVRALADRGDPSLARLFAPALASEDDATRWDAVRGLARLGGTGARVLLAQASRNPRATEPERAAIRDALHAMRRTTGARPPGPTARSVPR